MQLNLGEALSNILSTIISIGSVYVIVLVRHFFKKITESIVGKNELESLECESAARTSLQSVIESAVQAAVATNMPLADKLRKQGSITEGQGLELKNTAKQLVLNTLPNAFKDETSNVMKILGGKEVLNSMMDNLIEKFVYEYKKD